MKQNSFKQKVRQTLKTKLSILILAIFLLCIMQSCAQNTEVKPEKKTQQTTKPDYSKVDYSARSNIIKNPAKLTGDEKLIFFHPYFLKLTSEEAKNLKPLKVKEEFAKLGITTDENDRFLDAYTFYDAVLVYHKRSCEQWESFKDLAPQSKN